MQEQYSIALANEASISPENYAPGNPVFVGLANWAETCWSKALRFIPGVRKKLHDWIHILFPS